MDIYYTVIIFVINNKVAGIATKLALPRVINSRGLPEVA